MRTGSQCGNKELTARFADHTDLRLFPYPPVASRHTSGTSTALPPQFSLASDVNISSPAILSRLSHATGQRLSQIVQNIEEQNEHRADDVGVIFRLTEDYLRPQLLIQRPQQPQHPIQQLHRQSLAPFRGNSPRQIERSFRITQPHNPEPGSSSRETSSHEVWRSPQPSESFSYPTRTSEIQHNLEVRQDVRYGLGPLGPGSLVGEPRDPTLQNTGSQSGVGTPGPYPFRTAPQEGGNVQHGQLFGPIQQGQNFPNSLHQDLPPSDASALIRSGERASSRQAPNMYSPNSDRNLYPSALNLSPSEATPEIEVVNARDTTHLEGQGLFSYWQLSLIR